MGEQKKLGEGSMERAASVCVCVRKRVIVRYVKSIHACGRVSKRV